MANVRYHVRRGAKVTTVSVDESVAAYLALHVGELPGSMRAHGAVRVWVQQELDHSDNPNRPHVSQWLLGRALAALVRPELTAAYADYIQHEQSTMVRR